MLYRDVIDLITVTTTQNSIGDNIYTNTYSQKFANKKSVRQSEFYQAMNNGLKPSLLFEIRSIDYNNEESLRYNSKEYTIIRTYDKGEITELICEGLVIYNANA
jgi:SPP1 family predicted phage head-tail adaptor